MATNGHAAGRACTCRSGFLHPEYANRPYVVYFDEQRRWLNVTPGVCELLGRSRDEIVGKKMDAFVPDELGVNPELFTEFLQDGYQTSVIALVRSDGTLLGIRAHAKRLEDGCLVMWWEKL